MSEENSVESQESEFSEGSDQAELEKLESQKPEELSSMSQEEWEEYVLKVNGKEVKEKINLRDKDRITKALQMEKAAQQAFQERAITAKQLQETQQDVREFLEQFTSNPLSIVMSPEFNLSKDQKRALAEAILKQDLEESQKTPEQLALEETKRKYEELLAEKQAIEEARVEEQRQRLQHEAAMELENEIIQAIEVGELPRSAYISKKLADLAYIAYSNGIDLTMQELIPFVKQQYKKDISDMLGVLDDDEVETLVSKDRIRAIRNKQIQAVKPKENAPKSPLKTQDTGVSNKKQEEPQKIKAKDFFKNLGG
jgi:hypothetical protein